MPPGEVVLVDHITPMGVRAVALALQVPCSRRSAIVKGERGITADTALRLERQVGSEARGWRACCGSWVQRIRGTRKTWPSALRCAKSQVNAW
ncbi:MAG: HigA family addiction module antidote protein [Burkholderiales bacterium]|nr:HigA family addiction module antidote protein [Burkholderiales bacterium]